jgi:hypothetical protein
MQLLAPATRLTWTAFIAALLLVPASRSAWADFDNRPIVVVRMDDCASSWNTPFAGLGGVSGMTYCASKQIPVTWAIVTTHADAGGVSWAQFKAYLDANGGEAASHSVIHTPMPTQQGYIDEIVNSKAIIEAKLPGYQCNTFIQPGSWTGEGYMDGYAKLDGPVGQAIQANYAQSRGYLGIGWTVGDRYYRYGATSEIAIDAQNIYSSVAKINALLDLIANTPGLVITIMGHAVQETGQTGSYKVAANILKATMDKLADLRAQDKIRLMSMYDALGAHFSPDLNHVPDPGYELTDPSLTNDPWRFSSGAQPVAPGGVDDSRYCFLPTSAAYARSSFLTLPPGRYELSWYQKVVNGNRIPG